MRNNDTNRGRPDDRRRGRRDDLPYLGIDSDSVRGRATQADAVAAAAVDAAGTSGPPHCCCSPIDRPTATS